MKFSIITPSFNYGRFLKDNIESILSQKVDFEHIIIDGGSTDDTLNILKSYAHIKWVSEPDKGAADAINKGLKMATGDIVSWLNTDDFYTEGALKEVEKIFSRNYDKDVLVYGRIIFVDKDKKLINEDWEPIYELNRMIKRSADLRQPASFFTKSTLDKTGLLDINLKLVFDYDFFIRLLKIAKPIYINRFLVNFRIYNETLTNSNFRLQAWEIFKVSRKYGARFYDRINLSILIKLLMPWRFKQ